MTALRIILWDQLSVDISSLEGIEKHPDDIILLYENWHDATIVKHHKKKLIFLLSSMRHFHESLQKKYPSNKICYIHMQSPNKDGTTPETLWEMIQQTLDQHSNIDKIIMTFPSDYHQWEHMKSFKEKTTLPIDIRKDNRFLSQPRDFKKWAEGRKALRMEYFYREMRRDHNILMDGKNPTGGSWNYDAQNRQFPKHELSIPNPTVFEPDHITQTVTALVKSMFADHFGDIDGFHFAVTRKEALVVLKEFIEHRLPLFGDYQDAMLENNPWMYHSHISFYLNAGLLHPLECINAAEDAYHKNHAPINAVEGFIRQILGWREYVRGIYWLKMPDYKALNHLDATRSLPWFYWNGKTDMNCMKQCILDTKKHAYAHHIQRLMVLGNFALLAGIEPADVNEWYWIVYADAYEWVELPNVSGMILFADGGYLGSKPYAASGAYINKMSNYCQSCKYNVKDKTGPDACPFNYLYWDFLLRNREKLSNNHRMGMIYNILSKMGDAKIKTIQQDSQAFLDSLD